MRQAAYPALEADRDKPVVLPKGGLPVRSGQLATRTPFHDLGGRAVPGGQLALLTTTD